MQKEMVDMEDFVGEEVFIAPSDPVVIELNRLQNQLKDKNRELGAAHGEIKALKATEVLKEKAVIELSNELNTLDEKLRVTGNLLEQKNLEIKKLANEKKGALAAQFAAEAALRRVHANQKDDECVPIEAVIAPLESDIKMYKNEIAILQEDKKALERLNKSKEAALVESEKILKSAMERALIVEEVQNQNFELKRQIEICQALSWTLAFEEENRILDKTNRQKVAEVEKLSQTICELEESILAGGGAANAIRDFQRQMSELNEEKRTLERELARAKVSANRVASVVANEWKDDNDKVMPVKQWLEERRFLQGEMQRLRDKLAVSERTAKAEAQLKDKLRLRLKTLEEGLSHVSSFSVNVDASSQPQQTEKSEHVLGFLSNNAGSKKRSTSQPRASFSVNRSSVLQQPNVVSEASNVTGNLKRVNSLKLKYSAGENLVKKNLWATRSKFAGDGGKENAEGKVNSDVNASGFGYEVAVSEQIKTKGNGDADSQREKQGLDAASEDLVSGFLYDRLQREVIYLRKLCEEKDGNLHIRDQEIKVKKAMPQLVLASNQAHPDWRANYQLDPRAISGDPEFHIIDLMMLLKKVEALTKAMEVESKKMKREAAAREKEMILAKSEEDSKKKNKSTNVPRRATKHQELYTNSRT
ncbi:Microtubule-associated protein 70 [Cinnamomum micranthum f. kanehirae]|uniref:Microtubule-associated protein 70 n=1 Tax=Cinnamomum micranthum f. kanehirae TaxID=337451 RepID=A0A3S3MFK5_9MAGN|nr:Microtubule-associated protein 70 [Cinnamomum micranthum f. kanehirae]